MIPTIDYIRLKFDEFNRLCFEGKLQPLPFRLSHARTFLGKVTYYRKRNPDGSWHFYGFIFHISTRIDRPEDVIEDTIIHEMIHYWILSNQMQDTSAHGELFRQKMREINVKHNRNVSVSHKVTKEEQDKDTEKRLHVVCVMRLRNGRQGVMVATRSNLFRLWDEIERISEIAEFRWVLSTDPFFNRIRRAIKPKIALIPADELELHLQDAKALIRRGNRIKVAGLDEGA